MNQEIQNMVDAAINQDAAGFLSSFETALSAKVAAKLDTIYPEIAQQVMNPVPEQPQADASTTASAETTA